MSTPAPRRVTLSHVVEELLASLHKSAGEHSSVRLSRNAKGDTQIEVVVRTGEEAGLETIESAVAKAREVYDGLRSAYPMISNGAGE